MDRWIKINMCMGGGGLLLCLASLIFVRQMPLFLLPAVFGVGMAFKCIRNIFKNEGPPKTQKVSYNTRAKDKKKKK